MVLLLATVLDAAQAFPPITVQYEAPSSPGSGFADDAVIDSRVSRLAKRIRRARIDAPIPVRMAASGFLSQGSWKKVGQRHNASAASLRIALLAEGLPESEAQCVRDYNNPCPLGWIDSGDGGTCAAPVSYNGPCGSSLDFRGFAGHEKMRLAHACGAVFACVGACTADFSHICPDGWSTNAVGICVAPAGYQGPCVGEKDFANLGWLDKAVLESTCDVRWPCRRAWSMSRRPAPADTCVADYTQLCPLGWVARAGTCVAPASYSGPCAVAWAFEDYSAEEKHVVSETCGVSWPCVD